MKTRMFVLVAAIAVVLLLAAPIPAHARNTQITFTGSEWCDPDTLIFGRAWMSGPNFHADGITQVCYDTASIPQLTGIDYLFDARINLVGDGLRAQFDRLQQLDQSLGEAVRLMRKHSFSKIPVQGRDGVYIGLLTANTIARWHAS